ncbi:hypothetical protein NA78x_002491 [Anatilimnocola sp. NA78]|uniref:hypothetical protein n=1 Tax=Anatilimnocola sp. NA78 TaxID=3415683 RepID=UPI003CE58697
MITHANRTNVRVSLLVSSHILLGLTMAGVAIYYRDSKWPIGIEVAYLGFVCSQMLLTGILLGFAKAKWWKRAIWACLGVAWVFCISLAPFSHQPLSELGVLIAVPISVVAIACVLCRVWFATIQQREHWPTMPISNDLQFTLKTMIGLTVTIAVVLALGRFLRETVGEGAGLVLIVAAISLIASLAVGLLVWGSLGPGRVGVRLPTAFVGLAAVGLIFPYYFGGPSWRWAVWPSLILVVATYVSATLLVIRSCGYRLVRFGEETSR